MRDQPISALYTLAFTIAAVHALIPSHWLAFAVVGKARNWSTRQTLMIALMAGAGHVVLTVLLGILVSVAGKTLQTAIPHEVENLASGVLLIMLGIYFILSEIRGGGHSHEPAECAEQGHDHAHGHGHSAVGFLARVGQNPTIIGVLILGMTLSPCLDLLSIYVAAAEFAWTVIIGVSAIMAAATLGIMLLLVWLTTRGMERIRIAWLDRYEGAIVGILLIMLGGIRLIY